MELKDSTKEYLVNQIQQYYTSEGNLKAIFALYKDAFGSNLYGNIEGDNFNARIHYLVVELSKDSGTKLEKFIEITKEKYPEFAMNFNFAKESRKQRNLFVFIVKFLKSISYTLQTLDYVLRKTWLFLKNFWFLPLVIIAIFSRYNTDRKYPSNNPVVTETPITIASSVSPKDFVENYFSDIQNGEYQKAYDSLSTKFQKKSGYYKGFRKWWAKDVEQVHIEYVKVISKNASSAKVEVHLRFFMRSTQKNIFNKIILSLIWDSQNDKWLIDKSDLPSN